MFNRLGGGGGGGGGGSEGFNLRRRSPQILMAIRTRLLPKVTLRNTLLLLVTIFILRNFLKNDYREVELNYLRDPITQAKEIEKAVRGSEEDRFKFLNSRGNDVERLKHDVAYLLKELKTLRAACSSPINSIAGRDSDLKDMDALHLKKRKEHEAQLLKEHPNFVPHRQPKEFPE